MKTVVNQHASAAPEGKSAILNSWRRLSGQQGRIKMRSRLDRVKDWDAIAIECHFHVHAVARKFQLTDRQLQRYFQRHFGTTPKAWLDARRIDIAIERLLNGDPVKIVANDLNFKQASTFSTFFKRHKGTAPTKYPGAP